ncbi:MAG: hypothetical protein MJ252_27070, partial [archaeon]|nr:hypothetical protein [archaeon]
MVDVFETFKNNFQPNHLKYNNNIPPDINTNDDSQSNDLNIQKISIVHKSSEDDDLTDTSLLFPNAYISMNESKKYFEGNKNKSKKILLKTEKILLFNFILQEIIFLPFILLTYVDDFEIKNLSFFNYSNAFPLLFHLLFSFSAFINLLCILLYSKISQNVFSFIFGLIGAFIYLLYSYQGYLYILEENKIFLFKMMIGFYLIHFLIHSLENKGNNCIETKNNLWKISEYIL